MGCQLSVMSCHSLVRKVKQVNTYNETNNKQQTTDNRQQTTDNRQQTTNTNNQNVQKQHPF